MFSLGALCVLLATFAAVSAQDCGVPTNGLLLWLDSADYPDRGYYWPVHGPTGYKRKIYSRQMKFDPKEDAFRVTSDRTFINLPINMNKYDTLTIDMWVKLNSIPKNSLGWVISSDNGGYDRSIVLHDYRFGGVNIAAGPKSVTKSSLTPATGTWIHIAGVWRKGGASNAYYQGKAGPTVTDTSGTGVSYTQVGSNPRFKFPRSGRHYIDGWVGVVRVWGRALSASEIQNLYTTGQATQGHCTPVYTPGAKDFTAVVQSETERRNWWNTDPDVCNPQLYNYKGKWPTNLGKVGGAVATAAGDDLETIQSYMMWKAPEVVFDKATVTQLSAPAASNYLYKSSTGGGAIGTSTKSVASYSKFSVNIVNVCSGNGILKNGNCVCKPWWSGAKCGQCATGRWGYPDCDYMKWADNQCYMAYGPRTDANAAIFKAQADIEFADVVLFHRSGYTCNAGGRTVSSTYRRGYFPWECRMCRKARGGLCKLPVTPWYKAKDGCAVTGTWRITHGVVLTDQNNKPVIPEATTKTSPYAAIYRPDFKITGPKATVSFTKGETYKVWYGEVAKKYTTSDNAGKHCIDVYVRARPCEDEPSNPANGQYEECEGVAAGEECPLTCRSGYVKSGNAVCTGNPKSPWKTPLPTCTAGGCANPPNYKPANGNWQDKNSCTKASNGDKCVLSCDSGFVSKGDAYCVRSQWTNVNCHKDSSTNCVGAPTASVPNGRFQNCGNVADGSSCSVICNGGYQPVPGGNAKCVGGSYQTVSTPCVAMLCTSTPPTVKHMVSYAQGCTNTAGSVCNPVCKAGYATGRSTVCSNGVWTPGHCVAKCATVKCQKSTIPCKSFTCNPQSGQCQLTSAGTGGKCGGWGQCFQGKCVGGSAHCRCQKAKADKQTQYGPRCNGPLMGQAVGSFIEAPLLPDSEFGANLWFVDNGKVMSKDGKWVCDITADPNLS